MLLSSYKKNEPTHQLQVRPTLRKSWARSLNLHKCQCNSCWKFLSLFQLEVWNVWTNPSLILYLPMYIGTYRTYLCNEQIKKESHWRIKWQANKKVSFIHNKKTNITTERSLESIGTSRVVDPETNFFYRIRIHAVKF